MMCFCWARESGTTSVSSTFPIPLARGTPASERWRRPPCRPRPPPARGSGIGPALSPRARRFRRSDSSARAQRPALPEIAVACLGNDPIAAKFLLPGLVGELKRRHAESKFRSQSWSGTAWGPAQRPAPRDASPEIFLWVLEKGRRDRWPRWREGTPGTDTRRAWGSRRSSGHDVGVHVLGEIEADGDAARVGVGHVVGDFGEAGRIREPRGNRGGRAREWGARVSALAPAAGVNVPASIRPLACAARKPG